MPADDERRLGERVAALEVQQRALTEDLRDLERVVLGPPKETSLHGRIHAVENDSVAAKAAQAALATAEVVRAQQNTQQFSRREKLAALGIAAVVALCAVLSLALAIHNST